MNELSFSFGRIKYEAPHMYLSINEGITLEGVHMRQVIGEFERLAGSDRILVLTDARVMLEATAGARAVAADPGLGALVKANAILVNNLAVQLIANSFIWMNRPPFPLRVFKDEAKAMEWLREF